MILYLGTNWNSKVILYLGTKRVVLFLLSSNLLYYFYFCVVLRKIEKKSRRKITMFIIVVQLVKAFYIEHTPFLIIVCYPCKGKLLLQDFND